MACNDHGIDNERVREVAFNVFRCSGAQRGCGSHGWPPGAAGPADPCPNCGGAFAPAGTTVVRIGYCAECWPTGLPRQFLPSFIPINVVGGGPPAL